MDWRCSAEVRNAGTAIERNRHWRHAVKKNPNGSYEQLKDLMMATIPMPKKTYGKDTVVARTWDRKCVITGA